MADFNSMVEIFKNSKEIEQLIFINALEDLIKGIFKSRKSKKTIHSLYIDDLAKNTISDMKFESVKEYEKFTKELRNFIYQWTDIGNRQSWIFNITQETPNISKNIKEYLHHIWKTEVDMIHQFRKSLLINLGHYWFIEIFVSRNEELKKIYEETLNTITEIDDKHRRIYIWLSNIKDLHSKQYFERLQTDYWAKTLKKQIEYLVNDVELENYLCNESELRDLYNRLTWDNLSQPESEFNANNGIINYNGKTLNFLVQKDPYKILKEVYKSNNNLMLWDIFPIIYPGEEYSYQEHAKERAKIWDIIDGINRRFRKISWWNNLLQFIENKIIKLR